MNLRIVIMGLGYIGLPTAALLANKNNRIIGVDINPGVVNTINKGKIHIVEPDLEAMVNYAVTRKTLKAVLVPEEADVFIIAVPTPFYEDRTPNLEYVTDSVLAIIPFIKSGNLIILESTSPVGTTQRMYELIMEKRPELEGEISMCYCPERVLPGKIIYELEHNDRVIGGINEESTQHAIAFYSKFIKGNLHASNSRTAEMCKLVENSSRDVQIAFANELSMICDEADIDVWELIQLANKHPRVNILQPGPGVGGHCIAVDPWFLVKAFDKNARLIRAAREINDYKTRWVIEKMTNEVLKFRQQFNREPVIACMGLAFKPDIDDLRESPSKYITEQLIELGFQVLAVEPNIEKHVKFQVYPAEEAIAKADLVAMLVNHKAFQTLQIDKTIFDFCGFNQIK